MKKAIRLIVIFGLIITFSFTLSSCVLIDIIYGAITNIGENDSSYQTDSINYGDIIYDYKNVQYASTNNDAGNEIKLEDVLYSQNYVDLHSTGEQKILVIPVYFSDFGLDTLAKNQTQTLKDIENTFFGTSTDTNYWESVSSFYEKSSYGKLKISGKVSSFYPIGYTVEQVINKANLNKYDDPTYFVLRNAISWYKKTYNDIDEFDTDNDGYIDAVWLVYANEYYTESNYVGKKISSQAQDMLWAYTYWDYKQSPNINSPVANCYAWASSHFMYNGTSKGVDAHTFIHETGHMMGLEDYYDYDQSTSNLSPLGALDMMDYNIGDHNSYTKYLLGWQTPTLVTDEGDYELSLFEETGSSLLIPASLDNFSYSPFDEYLLLEFYSPNGLNKLDADYEYCTYYPKMFTKYGVKILHIDSRLLFRDNKKNKISFTNYFDYDKISSSSYYVVAANNTGSKSLDESMKLASLLSATGTNNYFYGSREARCASNSDLFMNNSSMSSFTFNNGEDLNYKISVSYKETLLSKPTTATIHIEKK